jgi:UTP-glucose-1-phosphate uridylyltransferase
MKMKPTLLILAAGMGSRYGGLKQIDPVGPNGEAIIDYSVFDALRAGFGKLVFVIRKDIEQPFRETIGRRFEKQADVRYVFQELTSLPAGFTVPAGRTKPWGTSHAILMAEDTIHEPFAAINADDFYGAESYRVLADHLRAGSDEYAMVGFILRNTLSEHGSVSRGVCQVNGAGRLESVRELTNIEKASSGATYTDESGVKHLLTGEEIVSMNIWGFDPRLFGILKEKFVEFLRSHGNEQKSEYYIPSAVNDLILQKAIQLKVLRSRDSWFGVTYREDKPMVEASIRELIAAGKYPANLWNVP